MKNTPSLKALSLKVLIFSFMISLPLAKVSAGEHCAHANAGSRPPTIKAEFLIKEPFAKGKTTPIELKLTSVKDNKPILPHEIKVTHTEKIHLLIFDQTLTDYQHIHPTPTNKPGVYQFACSPKKLSNYRAWVDLTPLDTDQQEYIMVDLGDHSRGSEGATKTVNSTYDIGEGMDKVHFSLSFDSPEIVQGKPVKGKVVVKDSEGKPFSQLEPVMGTFAHIVAVNEDFKTIAHVHPEGDEPSKSSDRGGPELAFELYPNKQGFWMVWVQVRIQGQDVFVPFGVNVS